MAEVAPNREPPHPGSTDELGELARSKRSSHRQRSVVAKHGVERSGQNPAPHIVATPTDQVVYDDTPSRESVERAQCCHNLIVGQVVEVERAAHVVERPIDTGRIMDITTDVCELRIQNAQADGQRSARSG